MSEVQTFTSLAQSTKRLNPLREALLGVAGVMGIGNTNVDVRAIIDQPISEAMTTGLQANAQVNSIVSTSPGEAANDKTFELAA
jgi:hypothetical protein